jgi:hypothetical protein
MRKKGGSATKPLQPAPLQSVPSLSYGYPYGSDAMSNAKGFLAHQAKTQSNLVNHHRGGSGNASLNPSDINAGGQPVVVPQFHEVLPAGPNTGNSTSVTNNKVLLTNKQNQIYDHYAFSGGRRRKNKSRRRKNKSRRRKNKSSRRKNKSRTLSTRSKATRKIQTKARDYFRTKPGKKCGICLNYLRDGELNKWHSRCLSGHGFHSHCINQARSAGIVHCPQCRAKSSSLSNDLLLSPRNSSAQYIIDNAHRFSDDTIEEALIALGRGDEDINEVWQQAVIRHGQ